MDFHFAERGCFAQWLDRDVHPDCCSCGRTRDLSGGTTVDASSIATIRSARRCARRPSPGGYSDSESDGPPSTGGALHGAAARP